MVVFTKPPTPFFTNFKDWDNVSFQSNSASISSASTDSEYPSAKCVYDIVGDIETLLSQI